jgi:homeobox protein cut-like
VNLEIDLSELQKKLDTQGLELVENQKESVVGRKGLADKTKGMLDHITSN